MQMESEVIGNNSSGNSTAGGQLVEINASFSTADIEGMVFYGEFSEAQRTPVMPPGVVRLIVLADDYYVLEHEGEPPGAVPFTPAAGLLSWADAAEDH